MGSLYGYEVETDLPLQRLNAARGTRGTVTVDTADGPLAEGRGEPVSALVSDEGKLWYASHELNGKCLLELPPTGEFLLDPDSCRVTIAAGEDEFEQLEHRIASSAICTLLALRGDLALHASAVAVGGRAVVFCGPSQRGKSTLVRTLGELGYPILGEDGVAIDPQSTPMVFPGARGVRLRTDPASRAAELTPDPGPTEPGPCPLGAIVLLGERVADLESERLEPARALALLTPNLVHSGGRGAIAAAFARLARVLGAVPVLRVSFPDDLGALPDAAKSFLDSTSVRDRLAPVPTRKGVR
jgi:hypothetical protein